MGGDDNSEKKPNAPAPQAVEANRGRGGGRRHNRNRWNNTAVGSMSMGKFKGKTPGIEQDIFDNTGANDAANFHRSLKHIADHHQLTCGNEVCEAIRTLTPVTITIPPVLKGEQDPNNASGTTLLPVSDIEIYLWKESHKKASAKLDKYEEELILLYFISVLQASIMNSTQQTLSRQFSWLKTRSPF
jgi:hypothetical protein